MYINILLYYYTILYYIILYYIILYYIILYYTILYYIILYYIILYYTILYYIISYYIILYYIILYYTILYYIISYYIILYYIILYYIISYYIILYYIILYYTILYYIILYYIILYYIILYYIISYYIILYYIILYYIILYYIILYYIYKLQTLCAYIFYVNPSLDDPSGPRWIPSFCSALMAISSRMPWTVVSRSSGHSDMTFSWGRWMEWSGQESALGKKHLTTCHYQITTSTWYLNGFEYFLDFQDSHWERWWCAAHPRDKGWIIQRERERERADVLWLWCLQMNKSKVLFQGSKTFRLTICTSQAVLGSMEAIPGARPIRICSP